MVGILLNSCGRREKTGDAQLCAGFGLSDRKRGLSYRLSAVKLQTARSLRLLTNASQAWRIFGAGIRCAGRFIA